MSSISSGAVRVIRVGLDYNWHVLRLTRCVQLTMPHALPVAFRSGLTGNHRLKAFPVLVKLWYSLYGRSYGQTHKTSYHLTQISLLLLLLLLVKCLFVWKKTILCLAFVFVCLHRALDSCRGFAKSLHSGGCCCYYRWLWFISIHIKNFKLVAWKMTELWQF